MHRIPRAALRASWVVASFASWVAAGSAATLTTTVSGGGQRVVGATVRIIELDRVGRSDARGQVGFADVPHGTYRVFASAIGFASATNTVTVSGDRAETSFDLRISAIPIEEIVISASPFPRRADELYQSAESKSQIAIQNSAGASFAEKISDLPGVNVRGNGSAPARPVLRGLSDNRVLVLENGLRTGDIATYDPAHATPIEAIGVSQIDVVRGPASILYGPSTIGGVVNVITGIVPAVSDHRISGTVATEENSVSDQVAGYFQNVLSVGHGALALSAGGLHAHDLRIPKNTYVDPASGTPFSLERMPQTFDHSHEEGAGYAYQADFGSIGAGWKHYEMNYGIPGVPPNPDWLDVPPSTSRIAQRRNTYELHGLFDLGGGPTRRLKLDASYNDYNHSEFPTVQDATGISDPEANHFHKRAVNATLQFQHRTAGRVQGSLGAWTDIEDLTIGGDEPLGPNSTTTGFAGFAYEELLLSEATRLQAGVRVDYNRIRTNPNASSPDTAFQTLDVSRLSNAVTASLGAVHKLTPQLTASVSLARSFRAPTVQELYAHGVDAASGTFSIGSAGLDPETGFGIDASLKAEFPRAALEVSPYVNWIDRYIYAFLRGDTLEALPVRQFAATNAVLTGYEASASFQPMEHVSILASSDFVYAQDTRLHVPLPFTPPVRGLLRGTYQTQRYSGSIEWRLAGRQIRLGDGDTPTAGYGVLNLGAGMRFTEGGLVHNLGLHCDNVLNHVYRDHLSVIKDFLPQPGLGFRLDYELLY